MEQANQTRHFSPFHFSTSYESSYRSLQLFKPAPCWPTKGIWPGSSLEHIPLLSYHIGKASLHWQHSYSIADSLQHRRHISFLMDDSNFPVTPNAVAVPMLALITLMLDIPPFIWHIRNRNLAASSLVFWVVMINLMNFINPLIWSTDDIQHWWHGHILCDVEIKIMIAASFGIVGSMACIMRNLAKVLDTEQTRLSFSNSQRRRRIIIDCLFCFGGPIYVMLIHYIVQPNRYYIFAISGCTSSFDNSWPKLVLVFIWPPIICLVDAYYSGMYICRPILCFLS